MAIAKDNDTKRSDGGSKLKTIVKTKVKELSRQADGLVKKQITAQRKKLDDVIGRLQVRRADEWNSRCVHCDSLHNSD